MNIFKLNKVKAMRSKIEQLAETLDDEQAMEYADLFPMYDPDGHEYNVGDRFRDDGVLYKVLQAHVSQVSWRPDDSPSLYAVVLPGQDGTDIGEWVQPDSTNPYMKGDKVIYNNKIYESTIDNNVWAPDIYGWTEIN